MYIVVKYGSRNWAVLRPDGSLLAVTLYKRGAQAIVEELRGYASQAQKLEQIPAFLLRSEAPTQPDEAAKQPEEP